VVSADRKHGIQLQCGELWPCYSEQWSCVCVFGVQRRQCAKPADSCVQGGYWGACVQRDDSVKWCFSGRCDWGSWFPVHNLSDTKRSQPNTGPHRVIAFIVPFPCVFRTLSCSQTGGQNEHHNTSSPAIASNNHSLFPPNQQRCGV
jgi:hypothetical protein